MDQLASLEAHGYKSERWEPWNNSVNAGLKNGVM